MASPPLWFEFELSVKIAIFGWGRGGVSRRGALGCLNCIPPTFLGLNVKVAFFNVDDELSTLLLVVVSCTVIVYNLEDQPFFAHFF